MRQNRFNSKINESFELLKFFSSPDTGALISPSTLADVKIYNISPLKMQSAVPVLTVAPTSYLKDSLPVTGLYKVPVTLTTKGWYWDKWEYDFGGITYSSLSTFYVTDTPLIVASDERVRAAALTASLVTHSVYLDTVSFVDIKVSTSKIPTPKVRLVSSSGILHEFTDDVFFNNDGLLSWLIDTRNKELVEGVYTLELEVNFGLEILRSSPMLLKINKPNDLSRELN